MAQKSKPEPKIEETTLKVVTLLKPLSSENRARVVSAVLTLLGETSDIHSQIVAGAGGSDKTQEEKNGGRRRFPSKAASWMSQNTLKETEVAEVLDVEGEGMPVIASEIPGNGSEKVHNVYVLCGISRLLATGDASFDDEAARELCKQFGCYDKNNHSAYMKKVGNLLSGSKKTGWRLTAPGLKRGADLVKQLTNE